MEVNGTLSFSTLKTMQNVGGKYCNLFIFPLKKLSNNCI